MLPGGAAQKQRIYLDFNASAPVEPEVAAGTLAFLNRCQHSGINPSSIHWDGQVARYELECAREELCALLGCTQDEYTVIFTSGATEANNLAIEGIRRAYSGTSSVRFVSTAVEHPSVLEPLRHARHSGVALELLQPTSQAINWYSAEEVLGSIDRSTRLLSMMGANNEVGIKLPIFEVAAESLRLEHRPIIHCDGVQLVGKCPVSLGGSGIDLFTVSGHKFGALPGVGALFIRKGTPLDPILLGGAQEQRLRGGTENTLGIVSLGIAARVARRQLVARAGAMRKNATLMATLLERGLGEGVEVLTPICSEERSIPNTLSVRFAGVLAANFVVAVDVAGVAISAGAACSSGKLDPSPVLIALGISESVARQVVRISFSGTESEQDVALAAQTLISVAQALQGRLSGQSEIVGGLNE